MMYIDVICKYGPLLWRLLLTKNIPVPPTRCGFLSSVTNVAPALDSPPGRRFPSVHSSRSEFQTSTVSIVVSRVRVSPFIPAAEKSKEYKLYKILFATTNLGLPGFLLVVYSYSPATRPM